MKIRNNIRALTANRHKASVNSKLKKNLEKLSTGLSINRAADDAAGLSIAEKMSAIISGMDRAVDNINEGIGLIQVGEGALQEVHDMLGRLTQLSAQSSNGIYSDDPDRVAMQKELEHILDEISNIAEGTNFNKIPLFQDIGPEAEVSAAYSVDPTPLKQAVELANSLPGDSGSKLKNIIYTQTVFDFETTQTPAGTSNNFTTDGTYDTVAKMLQIAIVPQVVTALTAKYDAFSYLNGSSIGIGLELYSDAGSDTLASVALETAYTSMPGGITSSNQLTYSLRVNVAKVTTDEAGRSALERTIAHEMIHALMDEATTVGMTGISSSGKNDAQAFPDWFVEGMAQTASGPGNWVRAMLTETSDEAAIQTALSTNTLGTNPYGTGYLACMYLGYLASGASTDTINLSDPVAAATQITNGLNTILTDLINGKSLQTVIKEVAGYDTIADFETAFATDETANKFVKALLPHAAQDTNLDNNITGGGLITGDLGRDDPVVNDALNGVKLFALDTGNTQVQNTYPPRGHRALRRRRNDRRLQSSDDLSCRPVYGGGRSREY